MLVSVADVAKAFGVDPSTVRKWETEGTIPRAGRLPGKHRKWAPEVMAACLAANGLPVPTSWGVAVAA